MYIMLKTGCPLNFLTALIISFSDLSIIESRLSKNLIFHYEEPLFHYQVLLAEQSLQNLLSEKFPGKKDYEL